MRHAIKVIVFTTLALVLVGCNGNGRVRYSEVTGNLTPELEGIAQRPVDAHNAYAVTVNHNLRSISDDIARMWYTDHPSRLSPYPIVYTSGQPR